MMKITIYCLSLQTLPEATARSSETILIVLALWLFSVHLHGSNRRPHLPPSGKFCLSSSWGQREMISALAVSIRSSSSSATRLILLTSAVMRCISRRG
ncbi:hypothetical protein F4778DRAFT_720868 [Xylariomycetidae sp. FL2044]|nr:hypothetical protein F4778DRAFT_720868 [Xylariomycetidae sp. FL2044]